LVIAKNHTGYETTSEERAISEFYARYSVTNEVLRCTGFQVMRPARSKTTLR
jgi:hypothetical protein